MAATVAYLGGTVGVALLWLGLALVGLPHGALATAAASGAAILSAAFMLSWAADVAQLDIPRPLAIAFLAIIAVLPEYAVDMYFAWHAGRDAAYTQYATANMTGSNRLLIGLGWAVSAFALWWRQGKREVSLSRQQSVEVFYLALATFYSFVIPLKGQLDLVDAVVLVSILVFYLHASSRAGIVEPELEGPSELLARSSTGLRRGLTVVLFLLAALTIWSAAQPFAESLLATGRRLGMGEFVLVQWVAPLVSEAPEFIVAVLFALRGNAAASIGTLVSSKVNQWTLLVGMLPAAYSLSAGSLAPMSLDSRQVEEILLTSAQSLFAVAIIGNFRLSVGEATTLLCLFLPQLVFPSREVRYVYCFLYLAGTVILLASSRGHRRGLVRLLREMAPLGAASLLGPWRERRR